MLIRAAVICFAIVAATERAPARENAASTVARWGDTLALDDRAPGEIERFAEESNSFSDGYAMRLATGIRRLVFASPKTRIDELLRGERTPFITVVYPEPGFAAGDGKPPGRESEREFEEGFVVVEVLAFFESDMTPEAALRIYTSTEFQMKASPRIKRIWSENGGSCIEVKGVKLLLSPTLSCNRVDELHGPGVAMQHSQVVSNGGDKDYQDVYFKESLKTFVAIPAGLALHYINYSRTVKMGRVKSSLGRGKIVGSREKIVHELRERLETRPVSD